MMESGVTHQDEASISKWYLIKVYSFLVGPCGIMAVLLIYFNSKINDSLITH